MIKTTTATVAACLLLVSQAAGQYKVLLPGCCNSSGTVFVLDSQTGRVERILNTGTSNSVSLTPYAAATLKNGNLAVLNDVSSPTSLSAMVSVVDPITNKILGSLPLDGFPWTIAANPESGVIYAGYSNSTYNIAEINPSTLQVIKTVTVDSGSAIVVSPDGKRIYIPGYGTGVNVYSTSTFANIGSVPGPNLVIGLSPDGKTLYAATDPFTTPANSVFFVNTQNFEITKTLSLGNFGDLGGTLSAENGAGVVSADGTQLYLNFSNSIVTLDVNTLQEASTALPGNGTAVQILRTPKGAIYVRGANELESVAWGFDPDTQTFPTLFPLLGSGYLIGNASGTQLYMVTEGSTLAVTGEAPSTTIVSTLFSGAGAGSLYGTYDVKDNLILLPDANGDMEVLDGSTLRLKGFFAIGQPGPTTYGKTGFMATSSYSTSLLAQILEFDPVSQAVTGTITVPTDPGDNTCLFFGITAVGDTLYAPYVFLYESGDSKGPKLGTEGGTGSLMAVVDTSTFKLSNVYPVSTGVLQGFAVAKDGGAGYLSVAHGDGSDIAELIKMDLATGTKMETVPINVTGSLLMSPDGSTLYMPTGELYTIDVQTLTITNSAPIECSGLAVTPDGEYLYCTTASEVDILSTSSLSILGTIPQVDGFLLGQPIVIAK